MNSPFENCDSIETPQSTTTEKESAIEAPCLNDLLTEEERHIEALFPDPEAQRLFTDIAANLKRVSRFVSRMEQDLGRELGIQEKK